MAKMTFKLPEETIRKMEALGSHYDAVTSAVLEEGVKPLYDAAKQSLSSVIGQGTKEPWESTGDLLDSLSVTKPYQSADGNWNIKVGCIGYDRKGVPNPLKAAVLEHGRSSQPSRGRSRPAERRRKNASKRCRKHWIRRWRNYESEQPNHKGIRTYETESDGFGASG